MLQFICALWMAASSAALPTLQEERPRLLLIDKQGQATPLAIEGLFLADPRERQAWSVRTVGFAVPAQEDDADAPQALTVTLSNGDRLSGALAPSSGETLGLRLMGGAQIPILIDHITRIEVGMQSNSPGATTLSAPASGDRVYRRTSGELDAIDGTFDSFVEGGIQFESAALGLTQLVWSEIAGLMIEDLGGSSQPELKGATPVILDLRGNSRLRGQLIALKQEGCLLQVAGQEHLFAWEGLEELLVDDGSLRFLSDLPALREEGRGQVFGDEYEVVWPHSPNRCVWKSVPLTCGGRVYRRGIGTHAPTKVFWKVPEGTLFLRGLVGIDDSSLYNEPEYRGSVIFRVYVDDEMAWESKLISGGVSPLSMPSIDLKGAGVVALEADMAGSYEGDRANWLEMLFVR